MCIDTIYFQYFYQISTALVAMESSIKNIKKNLKTSNFLKVEYIFG